MNKEKYIVQYSFEEYLEIIKKLIECNLGKSTEIGRSIRELNFKVHEVEPNYQYFRECYDANERPEIVLENLRLNDDELYRKIDDITNSQILNEVSSRGLEDDIISSSLTSELEDELETRYDAELINRFELEEDELLHLLSLKNKKYLEEDSKAVICEHLGFYNSYGVTYEEACEELKKFF